MKPNLPQLVRAEKERIRELERLIPVFENGLQRTERSSPYYGKYLLRLDELRLEYQERTGRSYHRGDGA